jgi:hypothetical protein
MGTHRLALIVHRGNGTHRRAVCSCNFSTPWKSNELQARDELQRFHIDPLKAAAE